MWFVGLCVLRLASPLALLPSEHLSKRPSSNRGRDTLRVAFDCRGAPPPAELLRTRWQGFRGFRGFRQLRDQNRDPNSEAADSNSLGDRWVWCFSLLCGPFLKTQRFQRANERVFLLAAALLKQARNWALGLRRCGAGGASILLAELAANFCARVPWDMALGGLIICKTMLLLRREDGVDLSF
ncbi:unnamed protein product, partial [Effrenium voratum]